MLKLNIKKTDEKQGNKHLPAVGVKYHKVKYTPLKGVYLTSVLHCIHKACKISPNSKIKPTLTSNIEVKVMLIFKLV